jgi:diguanylate cyclase (GGDEF)-like protein/PAS domain S-box-containing protein
MAKKIKKTPTKSSSLRQSANLGLSASDQDTLDSTPSASEIVSKGSTKAKAKSDGSTLARAKDTASPKTGPDGDDAVHQKQQPVASKSKSKAKSEGLASARAKETPAPKTGPDDEQTADTMHEQPASNNLLAAVVRAMPDIAFIMDVEGNYLDVYTSPLNFRHLKTDNLKGRNIRDIVPPESVQIFATTIRETLNTGMPQSVEYSLPHPEGTRWYEGRVSPVDSSEGKPTVQVVWLAREITHHKQIKDELKQSQQDLEMRIEERTTELLQTNAELMREKKIRGETERMLTERQEYLNKIIDSVLAMVYVRSTDNVYTLVSRKYADIFGLPHDNILGCTPDEVFLDDVAQLMLENDRKIIETGMMSEIEYSCMVNGEKKFILERGVPLMDESRNTMLAICGTAVDVTESKLHEEYITHLALHDTLTGIANRQLFMDRFTRAVSGTERNGLSVALLFIDLDSFKQINDQIGHEAGDAVLKETANRLGACVRKGDTVARFGGDEFVIIMDSVRSRDDIEPVVKRILEMVSRPIPYHGHACVVGASIGISICPEHGSVVDILITNADDAMYEIKKTGKNNYAYFDPTKSLPSSKA